MNDQLGEVYREWIETIVSVICKSNELKTSTGSPKFGIKISRHDLGAERWIDFFQGAIKLQLFSDSEQWTFSFDSGADVVPSFRTDKKDQTLARRLSIALRSILCMVRLLKGSRDENFEIVWDTDPGSRPGSTTPDTPPTRQVCTEVVSVASSIGVLHVRLTRSDKRVVPEPKLPIVSVGPLDLDEAYIQTHSLGCIEMVIETTGMTRVNSSGSVAAVSARSYPAYSYQSSSEFICPRKYSDEGVFGGSAGGSSEYSWEATEEQVSKQLVNRIASMPFDIRDELVSRYIEKPISVATVVNEIERIRTALIEYRIP
jgi:hypothetical protein